MPLFTGAATALVTPFKDGKVDFASFGQLIDWQIEQGIDGLVICGTTGEASTLNDEEHIETVRYAIKKAAGRVPVIAGAGSNDTRHAIDMSMALEAEGADGLLLVTPYYNRCTDKGLIIHYTAIADRVNIPIILYSVPARTGVNISPFVVSELCNHPNIVGIKEASGNMAQVVEIAKYVDEDFALYSGNDEIIVPIMAMGGLGAISVLSNIVPKQTHDMIVDFLNGDIISAMKAQLSLKSLIDALFCEVNPIPVKAALYLMGMIELEYRLPLCPPQSKSLDVIKNQMTACGLL
ncbi:MAG TPA: 4-hydroxy-tetrahydrodipicolinate synthase [Bacillota bacterium]|jgi:4-hydroxy-tetrahydrodipicolinate synthase|nr:4-hydroxy-tetrahydrodipicolinate synthase [Bacillota bacterium]HPZ59990.1 4-hydroxy-tetrahydrodipicolinate synthase [Bacillota bacterium]